MAAIGKTAFQLAYQISPILLNGGIASLIPGATLPIVAITQAANFTLGLLNGTSPLDINDYFAQFKVLPGSTLIDQQIGSYPFANQIIAANSTITSPLKVSMLMQSPANQIGAYVAKLATFTALQSTLAQHNNLGGTYSVATPSFLYTNLILLNLRDVTPNDTKQVQTAWQFDFIQPLLTQSQAQLSLGNLLSKLGNGTVTTLTSWSGQ